jgi:hypothetical protein
VRELFTLDSQSQSPTGSYNSNQTGEILAMFARNLSKYRVRNILAMSVSLKDAATEFEDYRQPHFDLEAVQKLANKNKRRYGKLPTNTAKIQAIANDYNETVPGIPVNYGNIAGYVYKGRFNLP